MRVATPSTVDCVTPHEFQGINTDVTEIESSSARLNRRGSNPFLIYMLRNRLPPRMSERYWSPVQPLRKSPLPTVAPTVWRRECILLVNVAVIAPSIPVPINAPPKIIALSTKYIVGIMPATPPVPTNELSNSLGVVIAVSVKRMSQHIIAMSVAVELYPKASMICGWKMKIPISPNAELTASVIYVFTRRAINMPVIIGMANVHGVILNDDSNAGKISEE